MTTLRSSPAGWRGTAASGDPHAPQNRNPPGLSCPQFKHRPMPAVYEEPTLGPDRGSRGGAGRRGEQHNAAPARPHRRPFHPWPEDEEASIINVWTLVRFVHVLSAMAWVGGQLLLSLLVLPVLRRRIDPASRAPLTREVGVRFGVFTLAIFLPVQVATGIALAAHRGVTVADLPEPGYGRTLGEKLVLFAVVLGISGIHGVAVGRGQDRLARVLGIATLLGSVGVVLLATALVP